MTLTKNDKTILGLESILLIPAIASLATNEVNWSLFDFLVAGALLLCLGLTINIVRTRIKEKRWKLILIGFVLFLFVLLWIELAVGIFNSSVAGS